MIPIHSQAISRHGGLPTSLVRGGFQIGAHQSPAKGSEDVTRLRESAPGDTLRDVVSTASLRAGKLISRVDDSRLQRIVRIALDLNWQRANAVRMGPDYSDYVRELALNLAYAAINDGDTLLFTLPGAEKAVTVKAYGQGQFAAVRRAVSDFNPPLASNSLEQIVSELARTQVQTNELVIVISNFLGSGVERLRELRRAGRSIWFIQVLDPFNISVDKDTAQKLTHQGTLEFIDANGVKRVLKTHSNRSRSAYNAAQSRTLAEVHSGLRTVGTTTRLQTDHSVAAQLPRLLVRAAA